MSDQVPSFLLPAQAATRRIALRADAARRLGARAVALWVWHRLQRRMGMSRRWLADRAAPDGPFLPESVSPAPFLPAGAGVRTLAAVAALPSLPDWHGPFDPFAPALELDLFGPGDIRPVWEVNRLGEVLLLAQAARLDRRGGHLRRAEALLADWAAANPPFRGPAWACGQEAALRALTLALVLALLGADRNPPSGSQALLELCAQRIRATRAYARAQDNNHPVSEAAGLFAAALLLDRRAEAAQAAGDLAAAVERLVAPDGGFAQVSPGYVRLLLDTLSVAEWLRRRHSAPAFASVIAERALAAGAWLFRLTDPETGRAPRIGVEDDSALADLALAGPRDARPSLERVARLFGDASAGWAEEAGCDWLALPPGAKPPLWDRPARWRAEGTMGFASGEAFGLLRTGPLRFRPAQSDLLQFSLRDGSRDIIRDGGTGAYNPPDPWWWQALASAAAHNAVLFDEQEPMPRAGRFLLARWPALEALPDGAALTTRSGCRHARRIQVQGRVWTVTDEVSGPFRRVALHWRLAPLAWRLLPHGLEGPAARISVQADAPVVLRLDRGWESPAYGRIRPAPVLVAQMPAPVSRIVTRIEIF